MGYKAFIEKIAPIVQKLTKEYGYGVNSAIIAQACLESAYGTSKKAQHNNFFGLKYRPGRVSCSSGIFKDGSQEQLSGGQYVKIVAQWYGFDNMTKGVEGYLQFINIDNYSEARKQTKPKKYLQELKNAGYATSADYVANCMAVISAWGLTKYDADPKKEAAVGYTNSSLVAYTKLSPNHSGKRTHSIDRITPHCTAGLMTAEGLGSWFAKESTGASCNYGIAKDGKIVLIVEEKNRSWCSSSNANDQRAVTIECASIAAEPYTMTSTVYNKLVTLCVDICKRNGKKKLIWFGDKDKTLNYTPAADEMILTVHRWFKNKSCPGDWLYSRLGKLASKVTKQLGGTTASAPEKKTDTDVPFMVQVTIDDLNIRKGPGTGYAIVGQTGRGTFTIVQVNKKATWGKLKSGAGWIYIGDTSWTKKIN